MDAADVAAVAERGTLADGTPWPFAGHPRRARRCRSRRTPITWCWQIRKARRWRCSRSPNGSPWAAPPIPARPIRRWCGWPAPVTALREPEHGPFRQLRRRPAEVRAELAGGNVLAYATRRPLNKRHIGQLRHFAGQLNARLLVLPLICGPADVVTRPEALVRAVLAARQHLPADTLVIPVPLARRPAGPGRGPARPGDRGRGLRRHPPAGGLARHDRHDGSARREKRPPGAARRADSGHQRGRVGL